VILLDFCPEINSRLTLLIRTHFVESSRPRHQQLLGGFRAIALRQEDGGDPGGIGGCCTATPGVRHRGIPLDIAIAPVSKVLDLPLIVTPAMGESEHVWTTWSSGFL
jgi:hypothetical protein